MDASHPATPEKRTRSRLQAKRVRHTLIILGVGALLILLAGTVQPFFGSNQWLADQLFAQVPPSNNIVIIGIDDQTLDEYGRLADWPRARHAAAISNLSEAGAKAIGFDVLFVDSSPDDQALADAIMDAGNVVLPVGGDGVFVNDPFISYNTILKPPAPLDGAPGALGHANITPDHDGTVRRSPLIISDGSGNLYPSLGLSVLHVHFSMPLPTTYLINGDALNLLARDVPVEEYFRLRINYAGNNDGRAYLSYQSVIEGNFNPAVVRNKITLIGLAATGDQDTWAIPTSASKIPGVYIHAAAMETVLNRWFLVEADTWMTILILVVLTMLLALGLPRWRLRWGILLVVVLFAGYLIATFISFDRGFILNMLYPLAALPILLISSIIIQIVTVQSDKRFVTDLFGRYVSPQAAKIILDLADANQLKLGGEEREATVLFADIRGFTELSESITPEATVDMLNTYLSVITNKVLENNGMVNKFMGDNIMAIWNAPNAEASHAQLAVKAAWEAQQEIDKLHQSDPSLLQVKFGIGINTGNTLAGNVGSSGRSEYTVIGDAVNVASRICGITPGGEIWIGAETYLQARDYLEVEELPPQKLKGKAEPVPMYRVRAWRKVTSNKNISES